MFGSDPGLPYALSLSAPLQTGRDRRAGYGFGYDGAATVVSAACISAPNNRSQVKPSSGMVANSGTGACSAHLNLRR